MLFNGIELSIVEIQAKMAELKTLQTLQKEAKKAGLLKTVKAIAEKSANYSLMLAQWRPVIEGNKSILGLLFEEFKGQDSVSFTVNNDYVVIVRSRVIVAEKAAARKAAQDVAPSETDYEDDDVSE